MTQHNTNDSSAQADANTDVISSVSTSPSFPVRYFQHAKDRVGLQKSYETFGTWAAELKKDGVPTVEIVGEVEFRESLDPALTPNARREKLKAFRKPFKEAGPCFSPVVYGPAGRSENNKPTRVAAVCADYDGISETEVGTLCQRLRDLDVEAVLYHTPSHDLYACDGLNSMRLVLPLAAHLEGSDLGSRYKSLCLSVDSLLGIKSDPACHELKRVHFLPREPSDSTVDFQVVYQPGTKRVDTIVSHAALPVPGTTSKLQELLAGLDKAHTRTRPEAFNRLDRGERFTDKNDDSTLTEMAGYLARLFPETDPKHIVDPYRARLDQQAPGHWDEGSCSAELEEKIARLQAKDAAERAPASPDGFFGTALKGADFAAYQQSRGPVPWVCEGLQITPGRPAFIAGRPGDGKTLEAQDLALAVVNGGKALGHFQCVRGEVRHLDFEAGMPNIVRRYDRLRVGGGHASVDGIEVSSMPSRHLASDGAEAALRKVCAGAKLLIIDSLSAALPGVKENESGIGEFLTMLTRVSLDTHCAFVVLHHYRKPPAGQDGKDADPRDMLRGSSAILSQAGAVWALSGKPERDAPKTMTLIRASQDATGRGPDPFTVRISDTDGGGLRVHAEIKDAQTVAKHAEQAAAVRQALVLIKVQEHTEGLTINALREAVGGHRDTVKQDVDAMVAAERLVKIKRGAREFILAPDKARVAAEVEARRGADQLELKRAEKQAVQDAYLERLLGFVCKQPNGASIALVTARCPAPKGLTVRSALDALRAEGRLEFLESTVLGPDVYMAVARTNDRRSAPPRANSSAPAAIQ